MGAAAAEAVWGTAGGAAGTVLAVGMVVGIVGVTAAGGVTAGGAVGLGDTGAVGIGGGVTALGLRVLGETGVAWVAGAGGGVRGGVGAAVGMPGGAIAAEAADPFTIRGLVSGVAVRSPAAGAVGTLLDTGVTGATLPVGIGASVVPVAAPSGMGLATVLPVGNPPCGICARARAVSPTRQAANRPA